MLKLKVSVNSLGNYYITLQMYGICVLDNERVHKSLMLEALTSSDLATFLSLKKKKKIVLKDFHLSQVPEVESILKASPNSSIKEKSTGVPPRQQMFCVNDGNLY